MTLPYNYVGCDISKHHLDFYVSQTRQGFRIDNTAQAIETFIASLKDRQSERDYFVVIEATGSYDWLLRHHLATHTIAHYRINPMMARRFAEARGKRAKTDALDARLLAELGAMFQPKADQRSCPKREYLTALARRRDQIVAMRAAEKVRLEEVDDDAIRSCLEEMITLFDDRIRTLESEIRSLIHKDDELRQQEQLLTSAPGVGAVTATTLLALLPELGLLSPKRIAALSGLAAFNHDSGLMKGRRSIAGGRARVRKALYMAALTASRSSGRLHAFYQRIAERSGSKKVAIIAVARKLLTILNAMIRDQKQWT